MVAPAASFTVIPLADVDPDSPVTTDLMDALRLNDQNLFAQLVGDPVAAPPFTAAAAHDHDGVNSAAVAVGAIFASAQFTLSSSGTTPASTGALAFIPKVVLAVGFSDLNPSTFVGFATGTGSAAKSLAVADGLTTGETSVDADSIGGSRSVAAGISSHFRDLDVTNFAQGAPGIELTAPVTIGSWTAHLLVFGFTA